MTQVRVEPQALIAAAARLDALASTLGAALGAHGGLLAPPPAGAEEVSLMAAQYFSESATSMNAAIRGAILELERAATVLRTQAAGYEDVDVTVSVALSSAPR